MNKKSKIEQLFILVIASISIMGMFVLTGCGGESCETFKCGKYDDDSMSATGVSIPGLGGCLTPGFGCGGCIWADSYKLVYGGLDIEDDESREKANIIGCDAKYYGGCLLGCGYDPKSMYSGCIDYGSDSQDLLGVFWGTPTGNEYTLGCVNGCLGCENTEGTTRNILEVLEVGAEIY